MPHPDYSQWSSGASVPDYSEYAPSQEESPSPVDLAFSQYGISRPSETALGGFIQSIGDRYKKWRSTGLEEAAETEMGGGPLETTADATALMLRGITEIPIQVAGLAESIARKNPLNPAVLAGMTGVIPQPKPFLSKIARTTDEEMLGRMKGFMAENPGKLSEAYALGTYLAPDLMAGWAGIAATGAGKSAVLAPRVGKMLAHAKNIDDVKGAFKFLSAPFTSKGGLTEKARDAAELGTAAVRASEAEARQLAGSLGRYVDEFADANDIDATVVRQRVADELAGRKIEVNDRALRELNPKIRFLIREGRKRLDEGGKQLIAQKRARGEDDLADAIEEGIGEYVHRQFLAFDDPNRNWKRIAKNPELKSELMGEMKTLEKYSDWSDEAIENEMKLIARAGDSEGNYFAKVSPPGKEGTSIYIRRKNVPEVIDRVLGLYDDPARALYHSISKVEHNVAMNKMWEDLARVGFREGWLGKTPEGRLTASASDELIEAGRAVAEGADGRLYVTPEVAHFLESAERVRKWAWLPKWTGWAKWSKTAGNFPAGHFRNFEANLLVKLATGNAFPFITPWHTRGGVKSAIRYAGQEGEPRHLMRGIEKIPEEELMGLRFDDVVDSELRDLLKRDVVSPSSDVEQINRMAPAVLREVRSMEHSQDPFRRLGGSLSRLYRAGDEVFKIDAYRNEMAKIKYHSPDIPIEEAKDIAASIVRDTWFNYGRISESVKMVRDNPIAGNFVSFEMEVPRIIKNNIKRALIEIRDGIASGNGKLATVGVHRLASQSASAMTPMAAKAAVREGRRALADDPDMVLAEDQERAVEGLFPSWAQGKQYIITGADKDHVSYIDASYVDYMGIVKDSTMAVVSAAMDEETSVLEGLGKAINRVSEPLTDSGIVLTPLVNALQGLDERGFRELDRESILPQRLLLAAKGLGDAMTPLGTVNANRLLDAVVKGESEKGLSPVQELSRLAGPRPGRFKVEEMLQWKARDLLRVRTQYFRSAKRAKEPFTPTPQNLTPSQREELRRAARDARRAIEGAQALGWKAWEIRKALKVAGMPSAVVEDLLSSSYSDDPASMMQGVVDATATKYGN